MAEERPRSDERAYISMSRHVFVASVGLYWQKYENDIFNNAKSIFTEPYKDINIIDHRSEPRA